MAVMDSEYVRIALVVVVVMIGIRYVLPHVPVVGPAVAGKI